LSLTRTFTSITGRIALSLTGLAVALAITMSAWLAHAAGPSAASHRTASAAAPARPAGAARPGWLRTGRMHLVSTARSVSTARRTAGAAPLYRTPHQIARHMLVHRFHWRRWQFHYLDLLWNAESGWNRYATNPYSGAYGIPQAVPGNKMATAGPRWRTSARTQIRWGMLYIRERYGTPYWAWEHERWDGWY
jgi:hypothetical protein